MKPNQSTHDQRGVSALEFTLIAPLVFVLIFGIIEFGCYFYDRAMLTNACREGARAGVIARVPRLPDYDSLHDEGIKNVVLKYAQTHLITFGNDTLTKEDININPPEPRDGLRFGDPLTVTVNYKYDFLVFPNFKNLGWVNADFPSLMDIKAVAVMKME